MQRMRCRRAVGVIGQPQERPGVAWRWGVWGRMTCKQTRPTGSVGGQWVSEGSGCVRTAAGAAKEWDCEVARSELSGRSAPWPSLRPFVWHSLWRTSCGTLSSVSLPGCCMSLASARLCLWPCTAPWSASLNYHMRTHKKRDQHAVVTSMKII